MGSKGSSPQTTQQSQQYTPNPYVAGAGQQAIQGAGFAAGQPFQQPVAPLAPFTPYQQQALQGVQGAAGMAQPYFGLGAGYLQGSAAPVTGQDVAGYYNPMAQNVMAGLQDIFGKQMRETTGQATQAAGGVGADRIGVAQAELARQQGLAGGQTLAGLYYPALQAAEQQKQMMAGAGFGLGQMGPAAQAAQLQSMQALMGAGTQQQQLSQQYLQNLYANRMAQIGYPFQTAQYLAGITGGLAPAMGGTSQGQTQQWAAQPSALAQGLGIGTSLLGLGMAPFTGGASLGLTGLGGSMKGGGMTGPTYGATNVGGFGVGSYGGAPVPTYFRRGGRAYMPAHMKGGGTPPPLPPPPAPKWSPQAIGQSGSLSAGIPTGGLSTQEATAEADPFFSWYGGGSGGSTIPDWARSQIARMTTPAAAPQQAIGPMGATGIAGLESDFRNMMPKWARGTIHPMGAGSATMQPDMFSAWMQRMKQQPQDLMTSDPTGAEAAANLGRQDGGGVSSPFDTADSVVPRMALQPGGGHSGMFPGQGIDMKVSSPQGGSSGGGGDIASSVGKAATMAEDILPLLMAARGGGVNPMDAGLGFQDGGPPMVDDPVGSDSDVIPYTPPPAEAPTEQVPESEPLPPGSAPGMPTFSKPYTPPPPPTMGDLFPGLQSKRFPSLGGEPAAGAAAAAEATPYTRGTVPEILSRGPYNAPTMTTTPASVVRRTGRGASYGPMGAAPMAGPAVSGQQGDWAQRMTRSPWWNLVQAGARMAQTVGPIGSVLGAGVQAFGTSAEQQRKELRSDQDQDMKAQALLMKADDHLKKYTQMTAHERASIGLARESLDLRRSSMYGVPASVYNKAASLAEQNPALTTQDQKDEAIENYITNYRRSRFGASQNAIPLPSTKEELVTGQQYNTNQGAKVWNGTGFVPP